MNYTTKLMIATVAGIGAIFFASTALASKPPVKNIEKIHPVFNGNIHGSHSSRVINHSRADRNNHQQQRRNANSNRQYSNRQYSDRQYSDRPRTNRNNHSNRSTNHSSRDTRRQVGAFIGGVIVGAVINNRHSDHRYSSGQTYSTYSNRNRWSSNRGNHYSHNRHEHNYHNHGQYSYAPQYEWYYGQYGERTCFRVKMVKKRGKVLERTHKSNCRR